MLLKKIFLFVIVPILVLLTFVLMYLIFSPRVGSDPKGERLERIRSSPNYRDGKFQNVVATNMDMPARVMLRVIWEVLRGGKGREPKSAIPTVQFDRKAWEAVPDSAYAIAWFGHSSVLIKLDGLTFLFDPVFSERASAFSFAGPKRFRYTIQPRLQDLPRIDVVVLSHDHYDHLDHESVHYLKDRVDRWVMPLGVGAHLERWGVRPGRIEEYDLWNSGLIGKVELSLIPTRHFSGRGLTNRFSTLWGGWVLQGSARTLLFGGDSGYSPTFAEVGERFGPFDLVLLECGAYNENWRDIHMFPEDVARAARDLDARAMMPVHWAKFNLALHPWKEPIDRLGRALKGSSIPLLTPRVGEIMIDADPAVSGPWWNGVE